MFEKEIALLSRRFATLKTLVKPYADSTSLPTLAKYYEKATTELGNELIEAQKGARLAGSLVNHVSKSSEYYFKSLSFKLVNIRDSISILERDIPVSDLATAQVEEMNAYKWLLRMVEEATLSEGPEWILCIMDEFKCWEPRTLSGNQYPMFSFVCFPSSQIETPLMYPVIFHEIGHATLSSLDHHVLFGGLSKALGKLEKDFEFRISEAGSGSKRILLDQWGILDQWDYWAREILCDSYALIVSGPAFACAMVHYFCGVDPYDVGHTHPPLQLRMELMRNVATKVGAKTSKLDAIYDYWNECKRLCMFTENVRYRACAEKKVMDALVNDIASALSGRGVIGRSGLILGSSCDAGILGAINDAWDGVLSGENEVEGANDQLIEQLKKA